MIDRQTLRRPWIEPPVSPGEKGTTRYVDIYVCNCAPGVQRGALGGVCGNCAGAIPSASEAGMLLNLMRTRSLQIPAAPSTNFPMRSPVPEKLTDDSDATYQDGVGVYVVEDGETYYYVAKTLWSALRCHFEEYGGADADADSVSVSIVPAGKVVERREIDGELSQYPDGFTVESDEDTGRDPVARAHAWRWARWMIAKYHAPVQFMSSVF